MASRLLRASGRDPDEVRAELEARGLDLRSGDVLELEPGTRHAATAGPQGVRCAEAAR